MARGHRPRRVPLLVFFFLVLWYLVFGAAYAAIFKRKQRWQAGFSRRASTRFSTNTCMQIRSCRARQPSQASAVRLCQLSFNQRGESICNVDSRSLLRVPTANMTHTTHVTGSTKQSSRTSAPARVPAIISVKRCCIEESSLFVVAGPDLKWMTNDLLASTASRTVLTVG